MKRLTLVALVVGLVAGMVPAKAHHAVVRDGSSEKGVLDVNTVRTFGGTSPKWKIMTYSRWTRQSLWDQGYLAVHIDTFGTRRHDYYALIWADRDRMRGMLFRDRQRQSDYEVGNLRVRRGSKRSVSVRVPLALMKIGERRASYNWYVQTSWSGRGCQLVCFDWAPNTGRKGIGIDEPLPV